MTSFTGGYVMDGRVGNGCAPHKSYFYIEHPAHCLMATAGTGQAGIVMQLMSH